MTGLDVWARLTLLLCGVLSASAVPNSQERLLITAPPNPQATSCANVKVLKRQENCEFGVCGGACLEQGAFCCGPAGSLATSPNWVCDNGACITSVRGTTGIVDCYDPDNPQGTTQSCIDNVPTTTCKPTDRCYTWLVPTSLHHSPFTHIPSPPLVPQTSPSAAGKPTSPPALPH
ncbi:uncharacterized protein EI97DRAFT_197889 [Westerdykella ornata]|uniref:Uncharacterized protein n=1 Tax=Westerdykella ornata TaxID=318751 RepID=A0A6A6J8F5_WESOR|nr:uncharacterized protein EI97DRAFT_197889 [Westerdykella ornata]KAF2272851.1 hypothetical protein EI97DRAFT_197889 [Westerdykella ornata]